MFKTNNYSTIGLVVLTFEKRKGRALCSAGKNRS